MKNKVAFIYHGSSGIAGGYSAKFLDALQKCKNTYAFVNFNFNYEHSPINLKVFRVFFPITDNYLQGDTLIRKIVRYCELFFGYLFTVLILFFFRIDKLIYSPITDLRITYLFLFFSKKLGIKLLIIVHDAQSHFQVLEKFRDLVFLIADTLIFHNLISQQLLYGRILNLTNSYLLLPFPWSLEKRTSSIGFYKRMDLLFIGHVRPSKGFDFLLEGYKSYLSDNGVLSLRVAGKMSVSHEMNALSCANEVHNKILSDTEFIDHLSNANFVILPYEQGYSNSSIHFCAVIHSNTPFICSNIELFEDFQDKIDCLKFTQGDLNSFIATLRYAHNLTDGMRQQLAVNALKKFKLNMSAFDKTLSNYFDNVLN